MTVHELGGQKQQVHFQGIILELLSSTICYILEFTVDMLENKVLTVFVAFN